MKFCDCLPSWVRDCIAGRCVREIRLRNNAVVRVNIDGEWWYCSRQGLTNILAQAQKLDQSCDEIVNQACNNSIYAYEQMLAQGYFTLKDGSRFGVAGNYSSSGQVFNEYTSVCIRVPNCVRCADEQMLRAVKNGNTLIVGAPATGKTTLLRDIAKSLSKTGNVAVVDERGELDVGEELCECDLLKWTSKSVGIEMALRCLSPNYIFCDELSRADDSWLERATGAGIIVVASLHANSLEEVRQFLDGNDNFKSVILCKSVGRYEVIEGVS